MAEGKVYYRKTVGYTIGVRRFRGDPLGVVLDTLNPVVEVDRDKLRDFKLANKSALIAGIIMETDEPTIEWETDNALTDAEITELTKSFLSLKARLKKITSLPILLRILEDAKTNDRPRKTLSLIEARVEELDGEEDNFSVSREEMEGVQ